MLDTEHISIVGGSNDFEGLSLFAVSEPSLGGSRRHFFTFVLFSGPSPWLLREGLGHEQASWGVLCKCEEKSPSCPFTASSHSPP